MIAVTVWILIFNGAISTHLFQDKYSCEKVREAAIGGKCVETRVLVPQR